MGADLPRTDDEVIPEEMDDNPPGVEETEHEECDCDDLRDAFPLQNGGQRIAG